MTNNEKKPLMNLPESTKVLVNQGVYSLYSLKKANEAVYALFADRDVYLLKQDGSVLSKQSVDSPVEISEPINFPELKMPVSLKVNGIAC